MELYMGSDLNCPKAQKLMEKLEKYSAVDSNTKIEFCCGSSFMGSIGPCLMGSEKELVSFDIEGILPRIDVYPYSTISGISVGKRTWTEICLNIGEAKNVIIRNGCTLAEGKRIVDFVLGKLNKRDKL